MGSDPARHIGPPSATSEPLLRKRSHANDDDKPRRYARAPHLWALGVGAVISGDFFGWQSALIAGFDGLLIILTAVTLLYVLLTFTIAELSSTVPSGGGPYVFALHGIGHKAAFFAGIAEALKVVVACSVSVVGIGSYVTVLLGTADRLEPVWWVVVYATFCAINIMGVVLTFRVQVVATVLSVIVLLVFYVAAASKISYQEWVVDQHFQFDGGVDGILRGFSYSLWFYIGIEELPLAVEDTIDPEVNMPRGLLSSMLTLMVLAYCTATFNSLISPGARVIASSDSPLLDGFKSVFGDTPTTTSFMWLLMVGLLAGVHSFLFCMGKLLFAMARDGYLPHVLSATSPNNKTPYLAFIVGSSVGLAVALILHWSVGDERLGAVLIDLALIGAFVSYTFQLVAFIKLRRHEPDLLRPYKSPFGVAGAYVCLVMCAFGFLTIIYSGVIDTDSMASVIVAVLYFLLGGLYYWLCVSESAGDTVIVDANVAIHHVEIKT